MTSSSLENDWYLAYTKPRLEHVAQVNLRQQGFEVYLPLYKKFKKTEQGFVTEFEPMFPRYLFFRVQNEHQSLSAVRSTRGVNNLVRFGFEPARIQNELVAQISEMEAIRNNVTLQESSAFRVGQSVRLKNSALAHVQGLVQNVGRKRIAVLLDILGRSTVVQVAYHQVEVD